MISVLHSKFLQMKEGTKKDGNKYYLLYTLTEIDNNVTLQRFFIDNAIAHNLKANHYDNIAISFDIWFTFSGDLRYKITNIVIEK